MARKPSFGDLYKAGKAQPETAYQRRIARGIDRGFSVSQARGHARKNKGEQPISVVKEFITRQWGLSFSSGTDHRYYHVADRVGIAYVVETMKGNATRVMVDIPVQNPWETEDKNGNPETHHYIRTRVVTLKQSDEGIMRNLNKFIDEKIADNTTNSLKALYQEPDHFVVILASPKQDNT